VPWYKTQQYLTWMVHIYPPGSHASWGLNYPALTFLMNGQYYANYKGVFGVMGLLVMSEKWWTTAVSWLGGHVEELANITCSQVQDMVADCSNKLNWTVSFDGFYLTCGHHSNNSSATLHVVHIKPNVEKDEEK